MVSSVYNCSLTLLSSGQHVDSDRPARSWQSSLSIPGEVQICSQVRAGSGHLLHFQSVRIRGTTDLIGPLWLLSRAIVFVVDSAIFQKEVRDVAEFLYMLLTDTVISRNAPTLLVACNKQGSATSLLLKIMQLSTFYFLFFIFSLYFQVIFVIWHHNVCVYLLILQISPWQSQLNWFSSSWKRNCK